MSCVALSQALIDRPDEVRKVENFKRLQLTTHKLEIPKLAKKKALKAALEADGRNKLLLNAEWNCLGSSVCRCRNTHSCDRNLRRAFTYCKHDAVQEALGQPWATSALLCKDNCAFALDYKLTSLLLRQSDT